MAGRGAENEAQVGRASEILALSRARVDLFARSVENDTWLFAQSLKSLEEDTAQEYESRALLELLQNGHDAIGSGGKGRLRFVFDPAVGECGALYVANDGQPFTHSNFRAITELGLSDKGAGEGIGNKGLGFRSVLQLTDAPEIYSRSTIDSPTFDGYCFRVARPEDIRTALVPDEPALAERVIHEVSGLNLPVPASVDDPNVLDLERRGFATVVRLPLSRPRAAQAVRNQLAALVDGEAPILLFLDRLDAVEVCVRGDSQWDDVLQRNESAWSVLPAVPWISQVDLGPQGRFLCATRIVPDAEMANAIETSIADREVDKKWADWKGETKVSIAFSLDRPVQGRLYTFLPMAADASSPVAGHAHAPFFTKLARKHISDAVALNDLLLDELAVLSRDLLFELVALRPEQVPRGITVDVACWAPAHRIVRAFDAVARPLSELPFVPVLGGAGWGTLAGCYRWPHNNTTVVTAQAISERGAVVVDDQLDERRLQSLECLHAHLLGCSLSPSSETAAEWVEKIAANLIRHGSAPDRWADFYDDLAVVFTTDATVLYGRKLVIDKSGQLVGASPESKTDERARRKVFFSPEDDVVRPPGDLRALGRRIAFTHPDIPWNTRTNPPRRRAGRIFLEKLVAEYRTDRVLDAIAELLDGEPSDALCRDALLFGFRQFESLNDSQRTQLRRCRFHVPLADGRWRPASTTSFSPQWRTDTAERLERFLTLGAEGIPEFARLRDRRIAPPDSWPELRSDVDRWREFLSAIGVGDGLTLYTIDSRRRERQGHALTPAALAAQANLDDGLAHDWSRLVAETWQRVNHPYTTYRLDRAPVYLPGASAASALAPRARAEFAALVLEGVARWADTSYQVSLRRPNRPAHHQDPHSWPTPLCAQLQSLDWLPVTDDGEPGGLRFVRPSDAWWVAEGELPPFVASLTAPTRRSIQNERVRRRLTAAGLRRWDGEETGAARVRELARVLSTGLVHQHQVPTFKKQCAAAWRDTLLQPGNWPWTPDGSPQIVVSESSRLRVMAPGHENHGPLYVIDGEDHFKEALLSAAGRPVVVAETASGHTLKELLGTNEVATRGLSDVEMHVEADGEIVVPTADLAPLVSGVDWLPTLVGLVIELNSGAMRRISDSTIRATMDRVRSLRVVRAEVVDPIIEGESVSTLPSTRSMPVDDDHYPTVVVWNAESGWSMWRAVAPAVCQLLGRPEIQTHLELAFVNLAEQFDIVPRDISDEDLAHALGAHPARVTELRSALMGETAEVTRRLRPVLACLLDKGHFDEVDDALRDVPDLARLSAVLDKWDDVIAIDTMELVTTARAAGSLADVRDRLKLNFGTFNRALFDLGLPYRPITYPEAHERAFADFIEERRARIVDLLRAKWIPVARSGGSIAGYAAARHLDGLAPDPAWLMEYESPPESAMRIAVTEWLVSLGASGDLEDEVDVPDLTDLRETNQIRAATAVKEIHQMVSAWCRRNARLTPTGWTANAPMKLRTHVDSLGLADLVPLPSSWILDECAEVLGWPDAMPRTSSLEDLGLAPEDLMDIAPSAAETAPSTPTPTIDLNGVSLLVGTTHLDAIARAADDSIDERFLNQTGKAKLAAADELVVRRGGVSAPFIASIRRAPEDVRTAIGLVGEVVARSWLQRRYPVVRWRSGYAALVEKAPDGSDTLGYDFEVVRGNTTRFVEVKAFTDAPGDVTEFELGESEVRLAQQHRGNDRYRVLIVTSVLEPENRQIFDLPSPFSTKGAGQYRVVGRGLRYRCKLGA